ncbi:MAG: hypothetical protein HFJ42_10085 [Clostridia bacterium]|nr:hypothetical protein [Clostridia bacterium]
MKLKRYKITYLISGLECAAYYFAASAKSAAEGMVQESNVKYWWPSSLKQIVRVETAP